MGKALASYIEPLQSSNTEFLNKKSIAFGPPSRVKGEKA